MIVVDSSVWIDHLNDRVTSAVATLRGIVEREAILVGDLVLCEVLQGLRSDAQAQMVEDALRRFTIVAMLDPYLASQAAANYRRLRRFGVTVRTTIDVIIGTYCIENDCELLHDDRDFAHMERHLGLRVV
jgi:predicted nucleic acid-binding protein